jgi:hypothetical protein
MHPAGFFLTSFMIVATEMQNAVDQEYRQLFVQRSLALSCLASRRWHRNHYITKQVSGGMRRLPYGKGQHIGRAILAPILTIETPHPLIAHELMPSSADCFSNIRQNRSRQSIQARLVKCHTSNETLHMDRH